MLKLLFCAAVGRSSFGWFRSLRKSFQLGSDVGALSGVAGRSGCVGQQPGLLQSWPYGLPVPAVAGAEVGDTEDHLGV